VSRVRGVAIGVVKSTDDPRDEGRLELEFPWMEGRSRTYWAPVATLMAGERRGSWFMPEEGDEVLVGFEHGDAHHPFVLGYLWNGVDKPPNDGIDTTVRRLRTVSGHVLEFDDEDGSRRVSIKTSQDHELELRDDATPGITLSSGAHKLEIVAGPLGRVSITTGAGHSITVDDQPPGGVTINAGGNAVELAGTPGTGVTIRASGPITVQGMSATVQASMLQVSAAMTTFAGVVQAQAVIAPAIVGSAYTPAPGNLLGL
jgi:phage baseplate assembly protein gpV